MNTYQQKFVEKLNEIAHQTDFEFHDDRHHANTGKFRVQDGFENVLLVSYDFQDSYARFRTDGFDISDIGHDSCFAGYQTINYGSADDWELFLDRIQKHLNSNQISST